MFLYCLWKKIKFYYRSFNTSLVQRVGHESQVEAYKQHLQKLTSTKQGHSRLGL